jgi:hypothetical protein
MAFKQGENVMTGDKPPQGMPEPNPALQGCWRAPGIWAMRRQVSAVPARLALS